jgi:hypothetical protein
LNPPVPTTPPVLRFQVPEISLSGSLNSTSLTPFGVSSPPIAPVRVPMYE